MLNSAAADSGELTGLAGFVIDVVDALGAVGVGLLVFLENLFPPIPSELVLPLSGFLAGQGRLSFTVVVVAATIGSVLGALVLYGLGDRFGRHRVVRMVERLPLVEVADLERAEGWFQRHGSTSVLLGRMVPGVRSLISLPAGIQRMPLPRFVVLTTIGSAAWNLLFVWLGLKVGERFESIGRYSDVINTVIIGAVGICVLVFLGHRLHRVRSAAKTPV